eukprot:gene18467-53645_t
MSDNSNSRKGRSRPNKKKERPNRKKESGVTVTLRRSELQVRAGMPWGLQLCGKGRAVLTGCSVGSI